MPSRPSIGSNKSGEPDAPPEVQADSDAESRASLTDGREAGDYKSRYPAAVWVQIVIELVYLLVVLVGALVGLVWLAKALTLGPPHEFLPWLTGTPTPNPSISIWVAIGLSGAAGGASMSLKWLYHVVAKQMWHRDRLVWRMVVPLLSAILSVFTAMMIISGIVPFFSAETFVSHIAGAAFGFFVGLFSDNVLASLNRLAKRMFGTVDS